MFAYLSQNCFFNLENFAYDVYIDTSNFSLMMELKGIWFKCCRCYWHSVWAFLIHNATNVVEKGEIFKYCLEAYRYSQGGIGSGYDIATSILGVLLSLKAALILNAGSWVL